MYRACVVLCRPSILLSSEVGEVGEVGDVIVLSKWTSPCGALSQLQTDTSVPGLDSSYSLGFKATSQLATSADSAWPLKVGYNM